MSTCNRMDFEHLVSDGSAQKSPRTLISPRNYHVAGGAEAEVVLLARLVSRPGLA